jgi:hypothetical protein
MEVVAPSMEPALGSYSTTSDFGEEPEEVLFGKTAFHAQLF